MRVILQRVKKSSVEVDGAIVGAVDHGMLLLVAAQKGDGPSEVDAAAAKLATLRIFEDEAGKMNLDIGQTGGGFLVVSQFTLAGSLRKGRRPSFDGAAHPSEAEPLVELLMQRLKEKGFPVAGGRFGAHMNVRLLNDGPVTFVLDIRDGKVVDTLS